MKTVLIYVITSKQVGDVDHLKVFANEEVMQRWFQENDPEGVAFEYKVMGFCRAAGRILRKAGWLSPTSNRQGFPGSFRILLITAHPEATTGDWEIIALSPKVKRHAENSPASNLSEVS